MKRTQTLVAISWPLLLPSSFQLTSTSVHSQNPDSLPTLQVQYYDSATPRSGRCDGTLMATKVINARAWHTVNDDEDKIMDLKRGDESRAINVQFGGLGEIETTMGFRILVSLVVWAKGLDWAARKRKHWRGVVVMGRQRRSSSYGCSDEMKGKEARICSRWLVATID